MNLKSLYDNSKFYKHKNNEPEQKLANLNSDERICFVVLKKKRERIGEK